MIRYSVIIRTMGKAGDKYQRLLNSIELLKPKPEEVIVVLPDGYPKPKEQLGWETFYHCPKGMVTQRLFGINKCKSQYALICDDDVDFSSDFIQKLHQPLKEGKAELSAGPLLSYLPKKGLGSIFYAITGAAIPRFSSRGKYISILPTTGYSYYRSIDTTKKYYLNAESLPWTCFYGNVSTLKKIKLEDEWWLQLNGYAALDDQTMFYKAYLMGIKTVVVSDAVYEHLDAKTSRRIPKDISYAMEFNRYVFWHRFIYNLDNGLLKKATDLFCFRYYLIWKSIYNLYRLINGTLDKEAYQLKRLALKEARKFVKVDSNYRQLLNDCPLKNRGDTH